MQLGVIDQNAFATAWAARIKGLMDRRTAIEDRRIDPISAVRADQDRGGH